MKRDLLLHCVYCGATIQVSHILYIRESPDIQKLRLEFEELHDKQCGPKSVGMIIETKEEI